MYVSRHCTSVLRYWSKGEFMERGKVLASMMFGLVELIMMGVS